MLARLRRNGRLRGWFGELQDHPDLHAGHVVADRGFGFITADDAKEYFFHRNSLEASLDFDRLNGGEKVEFEIEQSPKGPRANQVHAA